MSTCVFSTTCGACGKLLPREHRRGTGRKCCPTPRCRKIYYSGYQRTKCIRCRNRLAATRAAQRAAICGACLVDLVDIIGLERIEKAA